MIIQIRDSGDKQTCIHCGSTPLLYTAATNQGLEKDLNAHLETLIENVKWWQFGRRSHLHKVHGLVEELTGELRKLTIQV